MARARLGVDVGGTFTDLVALSGDEVVLAKVPSVPGDQAVGVLAAVERSRVDAATVAHFAHGTTVATNALLERRGARTALVTTAGFRDVLEIGRQARPALYDLTRAPAPPLVPRDLRFTVTERCGPDGVLVPLDERSVAAVGDALAGADVEAVAVCLLFGYLHPEHERRAGELLRARLPGTAVVLSSDVLPEFREYERFSTTVADAYLTPRLSAYLRSLAAKVGERDLRPPLVMQSSGGVIELTAAAEHAGACVLSGPAGGVVGAAYVSGLSGVEDVLTFDMGGTSTDVAPVLGGSVQTTTESVVAGVPVKLPMVDVHTVSAGGGSIAWADGGGALRVGPRSAGADPGPACYGHGGTEPTVTDADLYLGYLADGASLGGDVTLSREAADRALGGLGERLGMPAREVAAGIVAVADAEMTRALRVISVERGLDPREFALVAFGGAGGMHACALAEELGVRRVLVPLACGVLSALGLALSEVRRDYALPCRGRVADLPAGELEPGFGELAARARADLGELGGDATRLARQADCRYVGQSFELTVDAADLGEQGPAALAERFAAAHEQRYGYHMDDQPVEVVTLRLVATVPGERPVLAAPAADPAAARGRRRAWTGQEWDEIAVVPRRGLGPGDAVAGPAVVEFDEATLLVRPGWNGRVDDVGTLVLDREGEGR